MTMTKSESQDIGESGDNHHNQHQWEIGHCSARSDQVVWSERFNVQEGAISRSMALQSNHQSVVLFETFRANLFLSSTPVYVSAKHPADVAVILEAYRERETRADKKIPGCDLEMERLTKIDRTKIERQVLNGDSPMVPPSRTGLHQWLLKRSMDLVFYRPMVEYFAASPYRMASLCYFGVRRYPGVYGHVALTLDDAPGRFGPRSSRLGEIHELLKEYNAKATFMLVGNFISGHEKQLVPLLQDGHEFGNHGKTDGPMHLKSDETFLHDIDECSNQIRSLQRQAGVDEGVRHFRAPHGKYTQRMEELVHSQNMVNVMCDAYASDPIVEDGAYIARSLTRQARHGGIILLHIPERGFRDYCMVALRGLLEGLKRRNLKVVSVGMLESLAKRKAAN